jgi:hypothetical protein
MAIGIRVLLENWIVQIPLIGLKLDLLVGLRCNSPIAISLIPPLHVCQENLHCDEKIFE